MSEDRITLAEARQLSGYHPEHIRKLLKAGRIKAQKFNIVCKSDTPT